LKGKQFGGLPNQPSFFICKRQMSIFLIF